MEPTQGKTISEKPALWEIKFSNTVTYGNTEKASKLQSPAQKPGFAGIGEKGSGSNEEECLPEVPAVPKWLAKYFQEAVPCAVLLAFLSYSVLIPTTLCMQCPCTLSSPSDSEQMQMLSILLGNGLDATVMDSGKFNWP